MTEERAPYGQAGNLAGDETKAPAPADTGDRQIGGVVSTNTLEQSTTATVQEQAPTPFPVPVKRPGDLIHEHVLRVQGARSTVAGLKGEVEQLKRDFDRRNAAILEALEDARNALVDDERVLRALAVELFALTGNKAPAPGVGIREVSRAEYDPEQALGWAVEKRMFVLLDRTNFERFAKSVPAQVPFVKIIRQPEATISPDLSKAIGPEAQL